MTETIYESERKNELQGKEVRLPNNRRQIGYPKETPTEVFMEDYAVSHARALAEKDYTGCVVGVLVGECLYAEEGEKIIIHGILEAKNVLSRDLVCFTEENWNEIYRDIREYFSELKIVGWFLGGPGFLLEDEERQKKIQTDYFGGEDKVLLKIDSIEKELQLLMLKNGQLMRLPGYYIFYEKNVGMQNYMMMMRQPVQAKEPERMLPQRREAAMTVHRSGEKKGLPLYRLVYATGGVLACLALFVIGALAAQINEREYLKRLLNEQEQAVSSFCETYVVKENETIEIICETVYGSASPAEQIRRLNGLDAGENPEPGDKILLP